MHGGAAEAALLYGIGNATIVASDGIVAEVFDYFRHHTKAPYRWVRRMRQEFNRLCLVVAVKASHEFAVRDAKDAHVIAAAVEAQCDLIVTGDKDLLALGAYDGIKIITPVELIEQTG
ncbi:MAG TPA: putative toxin-antitoxin system toxin component, PIN family [Candidatus Saccharimonadales bacterium]|nr:putative toxin-antitoxin system toxin component, PIN family [Candidatus Saccharimonadales bacterium]